MPQPVAYLDESFHECGQLGFYVLAAAVLATELDQARDAMRALRGGRRTNKLHWNEMDDRDRHAAVTTAASLTGTHLVAIGAPVPPRGQERARRIVLRRLVGELHAIGVLDITAESRGNVLDRRDVELLRSVRFDLPKGTRVHLGHQRGETEPLLWLADIIASAVRASRQGRTSYRDVLADRLTVIEIDC
ncbi:MAG: hypothetical protein ACRDRK_22800 [Pseudonocardia sp.]